MGYAAGAAGAVYMSVSFVVAKRVIPTLVKGTEAILTNGTTTTDGPTYQGFRYFVSSTALGQAGAAFSTDGVTASAEL